MRPQFPVAFQLDPVAPWVVAQHRARRKPLHPLQKGPVADGVPEADEGAPAGRVGLGLHRLGLGEQRDPVRPAAPVERRHAQEIAHNHQGLGLGVPVDGGKGPLKAAESGCGLRSRRWLRQWTVTKRLAEVHGDGAGCRQGGGPAEC